MKIKYYSILVLMFLISACFHTKQLENKHNCSYRTFNEETYSIGDKIIMPEIRLSICRPASIMQSHINDSLLIVADFLNRHHELIVEIRSHTDFRASDSSNLILTQIWAKKYRDFFISKSIDPNRIAAIGFGESEPFIIDDCTKDLYLNPFEAGDTMNEAFIKGLKSSRDIETAHKINRRSEIVIIGKYYQQNVHD